MLVIVRIWTTDYSDIIILAVNTQRRLMTGKLFIPKSFLLKRKPSDGKWKLKKRKAEDILIG